MFKSLEKVDWDLLHQQKAVLLEIIGKRIVHAEKEALSGIVRLIDAIQDDAVTAGLWVFHPDSRLTDM